MCKRISACVCASVVDLHIDTSLQILTVFIGVTYFFSTLGLLLLKIANRLWMTDNRYLVVTHYGEGHHVWELSQENYRDFLKVSLRRMKGVWGSASLLTNHTSPCIKWLYISSVIYIPAAYATKATLLLLIARVFSVKEWISKAIRNFIIALGIAYLPVQIVKMVICRPISAYWEYTAQVGVTGSNPYCVNQTYLFLTDISLAVITDFIILIVPIPLAMSMRALGLWQKCKIIVLLSAGGVATATTVFRTVKIVQFIGSQDPTADFTILSIFT